MTIASAGRSPATFEIKSANLPLVALLLKSTDLDLLARELQDRFGDISDFFDDDPLIVDLTPLQPQGDAVIDFPRLLEVLRPHRVMPVAVKGGSAVQMRAALQAGLASASDATPASPAPQRTGKASEPPASAPALPPATGALALIIDTPLRSGQQIYARGRDLIMLSMVNPGAEVIADGSIHVYAPLRGKAIAGARGNTEARILSLCLEPELVSIAGVYRTSEVPLPADVLSKPTQVRLVGGADGKLVIEPLRA